MVKQALEAEGLKVGRKDWADKEFDWEQTDYVLFRTNWDYFDRYDEFNRWLEKTSEHTQFINSIDLVKWNSNKKYLSDLHSKGIQIIPTRYLPRTTHLKLDELLKLTGWTDAVIKPTVGGAGRHTYRIDAKNIDEVAKKLTPWMEKEDFMLQPFQYSVPEYGEVSLMIFGETYTHAVLKKAKKGDFRVQDDYGGTVHFYEPEEDEISLALDAVKACPEPPVYARIDLIRDNDGKLAVSELELIEPELWFRFNPDAASFLAEQIIQRLR